MTRYDRRSILFATGLSALAGFVDALGYLQTGGFFVSFMSGNSTQFGVNIGRLDLSQAEAASGIVVIFVMGVMLGAATARVAGDRRRPFVLALETVLLAGAAFLAFARAPTAAIATMALAMGCENSIFERNGEVSVGLTYMTGTLVKLGQRLAGAFLGGPRWAWVPHLSLWLGLTTGAVLGTIAFRSLGLAALWIAALLAGCATAVTVFDRYGVGRAE